MDLKKLDMFRLVARFGSLSRAAAQFGVTLQAVSIQIKKLETELGVKLFDHRPNRVILTDHGKILLREANNVIESVVRAKEALTQPVAGYEGNVLISVASDIGHLFAPKIAEFIGQHPSLSVTILSRRTRESIALVSSGETDMALGFYPRIPRGIAKKAILHTEISLVVPHKHPLTRKKNPTLADVFAHRVVARRLLLDDALYADKNPLYLPNIINVDTCELAIDFVRLGQGVALVHDVCSRSLKGAGLTRIDMTRHFAINDISLITRASAPLGPVSHALFQTFIAETAKGKAALEPKYGSGARFKRAPP
jgi:DNA-binding transcriptional LysR family regulator